MHTCYVIKSTIDQYVYIGYTTDFNRRLRQHNREIVGGAKHTEKHYPFVPVCTITGFKDNHEALSFEWHLQHVRGKRKMRKVSPRLNPILFNLNSLLIRCSHLAVYYYMGERRDECTVQI